jgi:hypothetical protein
VHIGKSTWPSFQVDNFPFPSSQVYMCTLKFTHAHCQLSKFTCAQSLVHTCTLSSFQVCKMTGAHYKSTSLHMHIPKIAGAHYQNYMCTLPSSQVHIAKFTSAHCQVYKFTPAHSQDHKCTLTSAQVHIAKFTFTHWQVCKFSRFASLQMHIAKFFDHASAHC